MDQTKRCSRCEQRLPRSAFSKDRHAWDGLVTYCKPCVRERRGSVLPRRKNAQRDAYGKTCPRCGIHKAWDEYNKSTSAGDGHQAYCRACAYLYEQESDARNAEILRARHAEKLARPANPEARKTCRKCGKEKTQLAFYAHRSTSDGRATWCIDCANAYQREWRAKNRARQKSYNQRRNADPERYWKARESTRRWQLSLYGMTPDDYNALLAAQGGTCAVCDEPGGEWGERTLCVDHDHDTRLVRGLLCDRCNTGLGHFKDSAELLRNAITYLISPPALKDPPPMTG